MRFTVGHILYSGKGVNNLTGGKASVTTKRKIGKVTYVVVSASSPQAKDTIAQKIQKNIKRDMENLKNIAENT